MHVKYEIFLNNLQLEIYVKNEQGLSRNLEKYSLIFIDENLFKYLFISCVLIVFLP